MNVEFLTPDDPRWAAALAEVRHDFYHLPGYGRMSEHYDHGTAEAALVTSDDSFLLVPYILRPLAAIDWYQDNGEAHFDACSPYGYPGPLVRSDDPAFFDRALDAWHKALAERRVVSMFVRLHPLLNADDVTSLGRYGQLVPRGQTVSIDLTLTDEEIWRQVRSGHRRNINRAREALPTTIEGELEDLDDFLEIYYDTMDRVESTRYFYFPREYFTGLKNVLGDGLVLATVRDHEGMALSSGCFTECCGIVQFHLSGSRRDALRGQSSKRMLDEVRRWAKQRGDRDFHLGGGTGGQNDALFEFKAGFSHVRHSSFTWHVTFLPEQYSRLTAARDQHVTQTRDPNFFPAYRAS